MRTPVPSAVRRLLTALALLLALACWVAPDGRAETRREVWPPKLPSGGPAAAHAHPPTQTPVEKPGQPSQVMVPLVPPAPPVLPPPIVVPTRPSPPPPPVPVAADAAGTAQKIEDGLRVTFGPESTDLNPETDAAIAELARASPGPAATFTVTAYAAGGDDPSTPRRLSLSRALAVRSALMHAGIASVRIYVKALGASLPAINEGPPDRVDIVVAAGPVPASGQPAPAKPAPAQPAPPVEAAPWGPRPSTTPSGTPPTAPVPTEKADP